MALDAANNRAFVTVRGTSSVVEVDLDTGDRIVVSSPSVGTGANLSNPLGIAYDDVSTPGTPRLLVAQASFSSPAIVAIDVATGNRTPFSSSSPTGNGPALQAPISLKIDAAARRLLVLDTMMQGLVGVNLDTGDRTLLGGQDTGTGVAIAGSSGLAFKSSGALAFTGQTLGEILEIDLGTRARSTLVESKVGTGARLFGPSGIEIEQTSGTASSLLVVDQGDQALTRVDLATGNRGTVSSLTVGTGLALNGIVDVVLDTRVAAGGNSALALLGSPSNSIVAINLMTGARTLVANLNSASPAVTQPRNLKLDVAGNRVLFTNNDNSGNTDALYAIDLATGARSTISDVSHGSGINFSLPTDLVLEPAANPTRAIISDGFLPAILSVDLATGNRSVLVQPSGGIGVTFTLPGPLFLDPVDSRLIAVQTGFPTHLFAVSLPTIARNLISGTDPADYSVRGSGPRQQFTPGLGVDTTSGVAFLAQSDYRAVMAIDLASGDRVLITH